MNVSRVIEIKMFDSQGLQTAEYTLDVSSNLLSKKWPKQVYRILRDAIQTCITGGIVVMRGMLSVG